MLSKDDLADGTIFILKLRDAAETPVQWVETLQGELATRWYEIYQRSDWAALRAGAATVFRSPVTEEAAEQMRRTHRCVVIKPPQVRVEDLVRPGGVLALLAHEAQ
jgi:hypothetical protein